MKLGKIAAAAAALTLAAAPIAAKADISRIAAPIAGESEAGGSEGAIIVIFGLAALAIGITAGGGGIPVSA